MLHQRRVVRKALPAVLALVRADDGVRLHVLVAVRRPVEHGVAYVALEFRVLGVEVGVHVRLLLVDGDERHAARVVVALVAVGAENCLVGVLGGGRGGGVVGEGLRGDGGVGVSGGHDCGHFGLGGELLRCHLCVLIIVQLL